MIDICRSFHPWTYGNILIMERMLCSQYDNIFMFISARKSLQLTAGSRRIDSAPTNPMINTSEALVAKIDALPDLSSSPLDRECVAQIRSDTYQTFAKGRASRTLIPNTIDSSIYDPSEPLSPQPSLTTLRGTHNTYDMRPTDTLASKPRPRGRKGQPVKGPSPKN